MLSTKQIVTTAMLILVLSTMLVFGQVKTKSQGCKYIACGKDSCSFVVQSISNEELKLVYGLHSSLFHKVTMPDNKILSLIKNGSYKPQSGKVKSIGCPEKDGFVVWSIYDDVLVNFFKQHVQFVHNKEMKDEDVKKLITSTQK